MTRKAWNEVQQRRLTAASAPADPATVAILTLVQGDPIHARDRAMLTAAIVADARANGGQVSSNRVRESLRDADGDLTVYPRMIGAHYMALKNRGILRTTDTWETSTDRHGNNSGKPCWVYTLDPRYWAGSSRDD